MTRRDFPGAWYADALPSGAYAVLFAGSRMATHLGRVDLPPGDEPLYHRITEIGGFQIAGQAHYGGVTWVYGPAGWKPMGPSCGTSPVIYDLLGILHLSDCSIGSQGWRYVERDGTSSGRLVTGDATYGPRHGLNEYTDIGDGLLIGQGNPDAGGPMAAALLWDGTAHRIVEPGACRFIRVTREGDQVAIGTWKEGYGAVCLWLTVDELRALPLAPIRGEQFHAFAEPWKVTVQSFDPAIVRGQNFHARVALGNGVEVEFQKDAHDELHVAVFKDGVQQDRSAAARHVEVKG